MKKPFLFSVCICISLFFAVASSAEIKITLGNSFIEKYKNRATIDSTYIVDKAHKKANPPSKDGDLHIAGRSPDIGLPTVAEIMNAAYEKDAVDLIHSVEGTGQFIRLSGAWRFWSEHGGGSDQIQGKKLEPFDNSNPDHVFEIHPVTKVEDISVLDSFRPIEGFTPKDAERAFTRYENVKCQIIPKAKTTTIVTGMVGYNYVEFIMALNEDKQHVVEDGRFVMASVLDSQEDLLVRNLRMVFVKDTEPEKAVRNLKKGDKLHVLGIPRIDLALVAWRAKNAKNRPEVLNWSLPYEIIVVGLYKDQ